MISSVVDFAQLKPKDITHHSKFIYSGLTKLTMAPSEEFMIEISKCSLDFYVEYDEKGNVFMRKLVIPSEQLFNFNKSSIDRELNCVKIGDTCIFTNMTIRGTSFEKHPYVFMYNMIRGYTKFSLDLRCSYINTKVLTDHLQCNSLTFNISMCKGTILDLPTSKALNLELNIYDTPYFDPIHMYRMFAVFEYIKHLNVKTLTVNCKLNKMHLVITSTKQKLVNLCINSNKKVHCPSTTIKTETLCIGNKEGYMERSDQLNYCDAQNLLLKNIKHKIHVGITRIMPSLEHISLVGQTKMSNIFIYAKVSNIKSLGFDERSFTYLAEDIKEKPDLIWYLGTITKLKLSINLINNDVLSNLKYFTGLKKLHIKYYMVEEIPHIIFSLRLDTIISTVVHENMYATNVLGEIIERKLKIKPQSTPKLCELRVFTKEHVYDLSSHRKQNGLLPKKKKIYTPKPKPRDSKIIVTLSDGMRCILNEHAVNYPEYASYHSR